MVALVEGTRLKILNLLQRQGQATVESLARALGLAPATVRRHLDILQRDQLVTFVEVHKRTGRPEYSYYLTPAGQESLPKGYDRLLGLMLQELASLGQGDMQGKDGRQVIRLVMDRLAAQIAAPYRPDTGAPEARITALLSVLDKRDFAPEVERVDNVVRIHLHNCPFRTVALGENDVCRLDNALLSAVLGTPVEKERCISDGAHSCAYVAKLR